MIEGAEPHLKLALGRTDLIAAHVLPVELLGTTDLADIEGFYRAAYPGTWFVPRMLATNRYVGIRRDGRLVCVAGVHVHSPTWHVAALGNVATLPDTRGQGLARGACAALCLLLLADGIDAMVSVVEHYFAEALAEGPRAETAVERRALLWDANSAIASQVQGFLRKTVGARRCCVRRP